jgi:uncharacterized protein (DUF488 family)
MSETHDLPTLYTIGHSNHDLATFVEHLHNHGITILVDVRTNAASSYVPHFNREALANSLPQAHIQYRYAGDYLGGQPKEETVYKNQQRPNKDDLKPSDFRKTIRYIAVMQLPNYQKGLKHLVRMVIESHENTQGRIAIMCSEGDPRECHRHHLIARSLIDPLVRVMDTPLRICHILRDGTLETPLDAEHEFPPDPPEQLSLF